MNIGYYYEYEDVKRCIKNANINKICTDRYINQLDFFYTLNPVDVPKKVDSLMIDLKNDYDLHKEHTFPRPTKYNIILPEPTLEELKKENEELKNQLKEYKMIYTLNELKKLNHLKTKQKKK